MPTDAPDGEYFIKLINSQDPEDYAISADSVVIDGGESLENEVSDVEEDIEEKEDEDIEDDVDGKQGVNIPSNDDSSEPSDLVASDDLDKDQAIGSSIGISMFSAAIVLNYQ